MLFRSLAEENPNETPVEEACGPEQTVAPAPTNNNTGAELFLLPFCGLGNAGDFFDHKTLLPKIINSATVSTINFGVFNIDDNHQVFYAIYKPKTGPVQIITIDPEYKSDAKDSRRQNTLQNTFKSMFPGCQFTDPDISIQMNAWACGYHAYKIAERVCTTASTDTPLFRIENDTLRVNLDALSLNGNKHQHKHYRHHNTYWYDGEYGNKAEIGRASCRERV